jgi:hypothetical protein
MCGFRLAVDLVQHTLQASGIAVSFSVIPILRGSCSRQRGFH